MDEQVDVIVGSNTSLSLHPQLGKCQMFELKEFNVHN
jgi:hypothetical protein